MDSTGGADLDRMGRTDVAVGTERMDREDGRWSKKKKTRGRMEDGADMRRRRSEKKSVIKTGFTEERGVYIGGSVISEVGQSSAIAGSLSRTDGTDPIWDRSPGPCTVCRGCSPTDRQRWLTQMPRSIFH